LFGGSAVAQADSKDQAFADAIAPLEIPFGPNEDLPKIGHGVCDLLTAGLAGSPNPVPIVRGVIQRLENSGMSKQQAAGVTRAAVAVYCPQHARYMGR
jgi:hypothetical protein